VAHTEGEVMDLIEAIDRLESGDTDVTELCSRCGQPVDVCDCARRTHDDLDDDGMETRQP